MAAKTVVIGLCLAAGVSAVELGPPPQASPQQEVRRQAVGAKAVGGLTVNTSSREAVRTFYNTEYKASLGIPMGWSGNLAICNEGNTSQAFRDAVARRLNYFRAMAGVPAGVVLDPLRNATCQETALMMSRNDDLDHTPPTSWFCYTSAGAEGALMGNLALGMAGPAAVDLYMEDPGLSNQPVGHRRWLLYPQTQALGTGDVPDSGPYVAANALWAFDDNATGPRPETRQPYIAWPPAGFVPYQVVWPRWSLSHPDADFSQATVEMTSGGAAVPVTLHPVTSGFGESTLVWYPSALNPNSEFLYDWPRPARDKAYVVTVRNIVIDGEAQEYRYTVTIMDPAVEGGLWSDAVDLGNGWIWVDWFGYLFPTGDAWLFHWQHGWLYAFGNRESDVWFWDHEMQTYWWTSDSYYPYLFRASDSQWLWYQLESDNPRKFLNVGTGQWSTQ